MTYSAGSWLKSVGNTGVTPFTRSSNLIKLGANNALNEHIIPEYTPLSNQLTLGSCVANATCDALEILKGLENPNKIKQLSRLFVYWNSRLYHQDTDKDKGTYIHLAMKSLEVYGVCEESVWPYKVSSVFAQPNILSYKEGNDNTLHSFYQITSWDDERLQDVEAAIRANHPVVFGTQVDSNFTGNNIAPVVKRPTGNFVGGHAMIITGVRRAPDLQFYIRNSWGPAWGYNGHCWMSADYISWDETNDLFVGTVMPDLLK